MTLQLLRHESAVLKSNPLGDPYLRDLWVYLPPSYDGSDENYPVLYGLAGFAGNGAGFFAGTPWSPGLHHRLDSLIANGDAREAIVVCPDGFTRLGGAQYANSPSTGNYEDYVVDEIIPFVDATFRTRPGARGAFGKSSGGYGALRLAVRRPGTFQAIACHSGDMGFGFCYGPDLAAAVATLAECGGVERWLARFEKREKKRASDFNVANILAMAAAYTPDPSAPLGARIPMDPTTGALDRELWDKWLEHDPLTWVDSPKVLETLKGLSLLFVDCGTRDEHHLHLGLRTFVAALNKHGIPVEHDEFDDGHRGLSYRFDVSLPKLTGVLAELPT